MIEYHLLLVLACTSFVAASLPTEKKLQETSVVETFQTPSNVNYRLPNNTQPISYDIHLTTNVHRNDFNFSGEVAIRFVVLETSRTITLHQSQLVIGTVRLTSVSRPNTPIALNVFQYDSSNDFLTFTTTSIDLIAGIEYVLTISYTGVLRTDNFGFYRTSYLADDGSLR